MKCKCIELSDISEYEDTDSCKAKYTIMQLQQENKQLKEQLYYLRSGEYYNQLKFERDMLQDLADKIEISKEDKEFIDCIHRITELLEELEEEKRINVEDLKTIDRQQEIIQELKEKLTLYNCALKREHEAIHRANDLEERIYKALEYINSCIGIEVKKELRTILKGDSNE